MSKRRDAAFPKKTFSTESTASQGGGHTGRHIPTIADSTLDQAVTSDLYDCSALLIHCTVHNRFGLRKISDKKGLFFPVTAVFPGETFEGSAKKLAKQLLQTASNVKSSKGHVPFTSFEPVHYFRLGEPTVSDFATRIVFLTKVPHVPAAGSSGIAGSSEELCCKHAPHLTWLTQPELSNKYLLTVWGIEIQVFVDNFCLPPKGVQPESKGQLFEVSIRTPRLHLPKAEGTQDPSFKESKQALQIKGASYSEPDVLRMYGEFVQHCFPSQFMSYCAFMEYCRGIDFFPSDQAKKDGLHYFQAFQTNLSQNWLSFDEFLLGMAAADSKTPHGGLTGESRVTYIHRFYDFDQDGGLNTAELSRLVFDGLVSKKEPYDNASLEQAVASAYQGMKVKSNVLIGLQVLKDAIGALTIIRGTSGMFRSRSTFRKCFNSNQLLYPIIDDTFTSVADIMTGVSNLKTSSKCAQCRDKKYSMAWHDTLLKHNGWITGPKELDGCYDMVRVNGTEQRKLSEALYDGNAFPNAMLDTVRDFSEATKVLVGTCRSKRASNYLNSSDKKALYERLTTLCNLAEIVFKQEPRLVKVQAPCRVFGDIHGNLHDLLTYERILWQKGMTHEAGCFLFLGDYVDRGPHSLEVLMYLFAMKIQTPNKVILLRGNHEIRQINKQFTFEKELHIKLGQYGSMIWERFNAVFDTMPVCAIIDETIFCSHGGIPTTIQKCDQLLSMPTPLNDPESQFPAAHEILWNDPIDDKSYSDYTETLRVQAGSSSSLAAAKSGFLPNTKRGTAYYYAEEALKQFCKANLLTHILRGHEVIPNGFAFHHKGRVITVFSSSKYCGNENKAACIFVDNQKLRPVNIDTN